MPTEENPPPNIQRHNKRLVMLRHVATDLTPEQRIKRYRNRFMYQLALREKFGSSPQANALLAYFLNGLNGLGGEC